MTNTQPILTISSQCIRCGLCVEDCPARVIKLPETGTPVFHGTSCLRCGHCEAVCPQGALTHSLVPHAESSVSLQNYQPLSPQQAEMFLRYRRSVRAFAAELPTNEETEALLRIGRYAQTAKNSQGIQYMVLKTPEVIEQLRALVLDYYDKNRDIVPAGTYESFLKPGHDRLLRSAPMIILALCDKTLRYARANAQFALTYIELMAPSMGLGTCWAGYVERYMLSDDAAMRRLLNLPDELGVFGVLLYGRPRFTYHSLPERDETTVTFR